MQFSDIDNGKTFDWGNTSKDYAKYRDIYPDEFYQFILDLGLCKDGQKVLDIGTGTGVLPGNMYRYGAKWIGTDISENQIEQAKLLASEKGMDIEFLPVKLRMLIILLILLMLSLYASAYGIPDDMKYYL